jgi:hypothetical protein
MVGRVREILTRRRNMNRFRWIIAVVASAVLTGCGAISSGQLSSAEDVAGTAFASVLATPSQSDSELIILNAAELPDGYPHRYYEYRFAAKGAVGRLHWRVEKGALPAGLKLADDGLLRGIPEHPGEFRFTLAVADSGRPGGAVQQGFILKILSALMINWKSFAHVDGNRIEGSVAVTNTSPDDIDLTFIVMAIAPNGRATAIGYQHFLLTRGTAEMELPFGDTLPRGGYIVNVDAVGEVAPKNLIYRERLQTPARLQVNVGP